MFSTQLSPAKSSILEESPQIPSSSSEEKSNLLTILEKNDKILNLSQQTLAKDKRNLLDSLKTSESLYKSQIQSLIQENQAYTSEITRLTQIISSLTSKLGQLTSDLDKSSSKNKIISQSLLESNTKLIQLQEKYLKLKNFSKSKQEKLKLDLQEANSNLTILQSDFSSKLETFSCHLKPAATVPVTKAKTKTQGIVTQDQLKNLLNQKKDLEKSFLNEKHLMTSEIQALKKEKKSLQVSLEKEKKTVNELKEIIEANETMIRIEIEKKEKEKEILQDKWGGEKVEMNDFVKSAKIQMMDDEEEYLKVLKEIQEEFQDYKKLGDEVLDKFESKKDFDECLQRLDKMFVKIRNIKKSINVNLDCVGKVVKEFYSVSPFTIPPNSHNEYTSEYLKVFEELKRTLKAVKLNQVKLENQMETVVKYFDLHSEELITAEKQKIQEFIELSKENILLHSQMQGLIDGKGKDGGSKDEDWKSCVEVSKSLLETLKKRVNSFKVKQTSELEAWILRENLYKKTIQSLNSQLTLHNSQLLDYKKLLSSQPSTYEIHISELQKELSESCLKLQVLSQDYSTLQDLQKKSEESFQISLIQVSSSNQLLLEFYQTGLEIIEKIKKSLI